MDLGPWTTDELRAGLLDLIQALHTTMAATASPGETILRPSIRHHAFVAEALRRLDLPGFMLAWVPHRTAGPELQNLRVRYEGQQGNKATRPQGNKATEGERHE